jgi:hypothetical protein
MDELFVLRFTARRLPRFVFDNCVYAHCQMYCWHAPAEGLLATLTASKRPDSSHKLA